jgi:hypothetical protein
MNCLCDNGLWQFGQTYGFIIQSVIVVVSLIIALQSIKASRLTAQKRATIDVFLKFREDKNIIDAKKCIKKIHEAATNNNAPVSLSQYVSKPSSDEFNAIITLLNHYEFIAAGIYEGAFDELTFKRMQFEQLKRDHDAMMPFVNQLKHDKTKLESHTLRYFKNLIEWVHLGKKIN